MRFTTTLACMMDLHHYPLDSQNCTVEIESCKWRHFCSNIRFETIFFVIHVLKYRWLHCLRRSDVLETDASIGCFRRWIATIYNFRIRNKRSKSILRLESNKFLFRSHENNIVDFITFSGAFGYRYLPKTLAVIQAPTEHWLLCLSDIFAKYFDCDVIMGFVLDKPRGDKCSCRIG